MLENQLSWKWQKNPACFGFTLYLGKIRYLIAQAQFTQH